MLDAMQTTKNTSLSLTMPDSSLHAMSADDAGDKTTFLPITNKTVIVKKTPDGVLQSMAFRAMICFQVLAYGSYSVLVHLCEVNGVIAFSSTMMNFILEFVKLLFSCCALLYSTPVLSNGYAVKLQAASWFRQSLPYSIPGVLYFLNNNLAVHMQLHMDPASYQILSNFKIMTTAILYRLIIKHKLSNQQWFALSLLFLGGLTFSIGKQRTRDS